MIPTIEELTAERARNVALWKNSSEHSIRWQLQNLLVEAKIPHVCECRIYEGFTSFLAVDIAVFIAVPGAESLRPLIAVELKNKPSRDEAMRGAGQCLAYLSCGFPHAILVTPAIVPWALESGLDQVGIEVLEPHRALAEIEYLYRKAGGQPHEGSFKYFRPSPWPEQKKLIPSLASQAVNQVAP